MAQNLLSLLRVWYSSLLWLTRNFLSLTLSLLLFREYERDFPRITTSLEKVVSNSLLGYSKMKPEQCRPQALSPDQTGQPGHVLLLPCPSPVLLPPSPPSSFLHIDTCLQTARCSGLRLRNPWFLWSFPSRHWFYLPRLQGLLRNRSLFLRYPCRIKNQTKHCLSLLR